MKKIVQIILFTIAIVTGSVVLFFYLINTAGSSHSGPGTVMDGFGDLLLILMKVVAFFIVSVIGVIIYFTIKK
ncbi:MAG: hypothetical protein LBE92_05450 [Chryseobacterium sp.]|jgi:hypothetical protein|uniref:hypothetical protein n=1 Tax=Chryseobacterium sp. TaxID=1871047 RepID=UPI00281FD185|nr:hypothetical protein [Chryseobacterium sp.]MDR2235547.1 hypothetical protein [Chryseobacterium sp.]